MNWAATVVVLGLAAAGRAAAHAGPLAVEALALHAFDGGPPLAGTPSFVDGETIFFSCLVSGYQSDAKDAVSIKWTVEARDDDERLLAKAESGHIAVELAPEDKDWKPKIRFQFVIPQTAACENCRIRVKLQDEVAKKQAQGEIRFRVRSKDVSPSETLVVRNFRFLRSEEDAEGLRIPSYRSGDELWARFEMTGYRFGPDYRVSVEYGLEVYRPSGALLYREPAAAQYDETSFYPKRFLPGVLSLRLQDLPPGDYPLLVRVRDRIGNQIAEARAVFRVE